MYSSKVEKQMTAQVQTQKYNGWANYQTWNVALWIGNNEGLYNFAKTCDTYLEFANEMKNLWGASKTPDGVSYSDPNLCLSELANFFADL
jgi:hypothetical protein